MSATRSPAPRKADALPRWLVLLMGLALGLAVTSQAQAHAARAILRACETSPALPSS